MPLIPHPATLAAHNPAQNTDTISQQGSCVSDIVSCPCQPGGRFGGPERRLDLFLSRADCARAPPPDGATPLGQPRRSPGNIHRCSARSAHAARARSAGHWERRHLAGNWVPRRLAGCITLASLSRGSWIRLTRLAKALVLRDQKAEPRVARCFRDLRAGVLGAWLARANACEIRATISQSRT
jgi:hypothetical protein